MWHPTQSSDAVSDTLISPVLPREKWCQVPISVVLWLLDYNLSVAVWVGIIALAGVAAEIGIVVVTFLDEAIRRKKEPGGEWTSVAVSEAIMQGAIRRVRPVVMTASAIFLGLLPIAEQKSLLRPTR